MQTGVSCTIRQKDFGKPHPFISQGQAKSIVRTCILLVHAEIGMDLTWYLKGDTLLYWSNYFRTACLLHKREV